MNVETVNNSRDLAQMMTSLNLDIEARRKFIEATQIEEPMLYEAFEGAIKYFLACCE